MADRTWTRLTRRGLLRGALTIAAGTGLAQVITLGVSPIITRLYSPAEFGTYAAAGSLLGILIGVTSLSYHYAVPLPESDDEASTVVVLSLIVATIMSALTAVVLLLVGDTVLTSLGSAALAPYAVLLAIGQFAGGTVAILRSWAVRTRSYGQVGAQRVTQSLTQAATQVGFGIAGAGALGLLLGSVLGNFAGATRFARHAWRGHARSFKAVTPAGIRAAASRYKRFPLLAAPSRLLDSVSNQAPVLLMVALYGVATGGLFAMSQRVFSMPIGLVASSVGQAYFGEAAKLANRAPDDLMRMFIRTTRSLALAALLPLVLAIVVAPLVFGFIFGKEWAVAGLYVAILAPANYLRLVTGPTGYTLDILERQDLLGLKETFLVATTAGVIVVAALLDLPATQAVILFSAVGCANYALAGVLSWYAIRTRARRFDASRE